MIDDQLMNNLKLLSKEENKYIACCLVRSNRYLDLADDPTKIKNEKLDNFVVDFINTFGHTVEDVEILGDILLSVGTGVNYTISGSTTPLIDEEATSEAYNILKTDILEYSNKDYYLDILEYIIQHRLKNIKYVYRLMDALGKERIKIRCRGAKEFL